MACQRAIRRSILASRLAIWQRWRPCVSVGSARSALCVVCYHCGAQTPLSPTSVGPVPAGPSQTASTVPSPDAPATDILPSLGTGASEIFVGAGDIAMCGALDPARQTAQLLVRNRRHGLHARRQPVPGARCATIQRAATTDMGPRTGAARVPLRATTNTTTAWPPRRISITSGPARGRRARLLQLPAGQLARDRPQQQRQHRGTGGLAAERPRSQPEEVHPRLLASPALWVGTERGNAGRPRPVARALQGRTRILS